MRHLTGVLAAAILCATAGARAASARPIEPGLRARLDRIEKAFRDERAGALRQSFSDEAKLRVHIRDLPAAQGSYGPRQLEVIFGDIFSAYRTTDFRFGRDEVTVSSPNTAFARGRWRRRSRRGGEETLDTLTFTLRRRGQDWRILEIRSSR